MMQYSCKVISIGTGCLSRSLLLPILQEIGWGAIVAQPRKADIVELFKKKNGIFEYDIVHGDGKQEKIVLNNVLDAHSLCDDASLQHFLELPEKHRDTLEMLAIGVTEVGLEPNAPAINILAQLLSRCHQHLPSDRILSVVNIDNLSNNGPTIYERVLTCDAFHEVEDQSGFRSWLEKQVVFHVTMVDRITTNDPETMQPLTEPIPPRALGIDDPKGNLPKDLYKAPGVVVRKNSDEVRKDQRIKLLVLNGTHTALASLLALCQRTAHNPYCGFPEVNIYIREYFKSCILPAVCKETGCSKEEATEQFDSWIARLGNERFSMHPLKICRNPMSKLENRLLPLAKHSKRWDKPARQLLAFAIACSLRSMTPALNKRFDNEKFYGWMDSVPKSSSENSGVQEYMKDLTVDYDNATYQFTVEDPSLPELLYEAAFERREDKAHKLLSTAISGVKGHQNINRNRHMDKDIFLLYRQMTFDGISALQTLHDVLEANRLLPDSKKKGESGEKLLTDDSLERVKEQHFKMLFCDAMQQRRLAG